MTRDMGDIFTTKTEKFTDSDSCDMAWLVYRRFGRDVEAAAVAWRRLLQNNCSDAQFHALVQGSSLNDAAVEKKSVASPFPMPLSDGRIAVDERCHCGALRSYHATGGAGFAYGHGPCAATGCKQFTWAEIITDV